MKKEAKYDISFQVLDKSKKPLSRIKRVKIVTDFFETEIRPGFNIAFVNKRPIKIPVLKNKMGKFTEKDMGFLRIWVYWHLFCEVPLYDSGDEEEIKDYFDFCEGFLAFIYPPEGTFKFVENGENINGKTPIKY